MWLLAFWISLVFFALGCQSSDPPVAGGETPDAESALGSPPKNEPSDGPPPVEEDENPDGSSTQTTVSGPATDSSSSTASTTNSSPSTEQSSTSTTTTTAVPASIPQPTTSSSTTSTTESSLSATRTEEIRTVAAGYASFLRDTSKGSTGAPLEFTTGKLRRTYENSGPAEGVFVRWLAVDSAEVTDIDFKDQDPGLRLTDDVIVTLRWTFTLEEVDVDTGSPTGPPETFSTDNLVVGVVETEAGFRVANIYEASMNAE